MWKVGMEGRDLGWPRGGGGPSKHTCDGGTKEGNRVRVRVRGEMEALVVLEMRMKRMLKGWEGSWSRNRRRKRGEVKKLHVNGLGAKATKKVAIVERPHLS